MQTKNHLPFRKLFVYAIYFLVSSVLTIGTASLSYGGTTTTQPTAESCRKFVQEFYTWYRSKNITMEDALKKRASSFAPPLTKQLKIDEAASAASPGEVVGLDFDPFLNAQDIPDRITVGKVTAKGDNYLVEVFEAFSGEKNSKPVVVPELTLKNGQWTFINFHYPQADIKQNSDLISVLKALEAERVQTAKASSHSNREGPTR